MADTLTFPFCKYTDFTSEILVPNLVPNTDIGTSNIEDLEEFILKYETRLLRALLGDGWEDFKDEMEGETPDTVDQGLYDLLYVNEKAVAFFIYFWFMRNSQTFTSGTGEVAPTVENGTSVSSGYKMVSAWNEFAKSIIDIVDYLQLNETYFLAQTDYLVNFNKLLTDFAPINTFNV
jgi:hypothetical protein